MKTGAIRPPAGSATARAVIMSLVAACLVANVAAQSVTESLAADYKATVERYRSLLDFDVPLAATPRLPPASGASGPEPGVAGAAARLTLQDLLAGAARANPTLMAAAEAEEAAAADLAGARARRLPTLKAETSGSLIGNPLQAITLTAGQLGDIQGVALPPQDIIIYEGMEDTRYDFKLIGDVPLYTWGKIEAGIGLARTGLAAAALQSEKATWELAVKIRGTWEALAYVSEAERVVALQRSIGNRLVDLSEKSAAAGFMTPSELASARIKLKEIDLAQARLADQRNRMLADLAYMSGIDIASVDRLSLAAGPAGRLAWSEPEAWEQARAGSYDLALAAAMVEARRGMRDLAEREARGLPDIGLHLELSYGGARFPFLETDWYGQDDWQLTFSLGTSGNLFGSGVKRGEAAKAKAKASEAEAQSADASRAVRAFIRETFLGMDLQRARLEYAALKQDGWAADLAQKRAAMDAGAGSEPEYLSLMMEALGGVAEAYGTLAEYRGALLSVEAAAGASAGTTADISVP